MAEQHTILGGKVHVYKRPNSSSWQCSSYLAGRNRRVTTKEESLSKAKEFAEDWYLQLRGKLRTGELKSEKTFREASEQYLREYDILTQGQRSKAYLRGQHSRASGHLVPFFGRLCEQLHYDIGDRGRYARRTLFRRLRLSGYVTVDPFHRVGCREGKTPSQHLVKRDTE